MKTLRSRHIRCALVPVMAVSLLSACHHWKVQQMAPAHVVAEKQPDRVHLTMLDGNTIELFYPTVAAGEIVGYRYGGVDYPYAQWCGEYVECDTLRVRADSVAEIEIRETDVVATGAAVLAVLGGILVAIAIGSYVELCRNFGC